VKTLLFIAFIFLSFNQIHDQSEYVCTPCGGSCDTKIHNGPGKCSVCGMPLVEKSSAGFANLTVKEFCERITSNSQAVILDVRSAGEFDGSNSRNTFGHFKNAINIPIDQLESRIEELANFKEKEILVYCSHSQRSPRASYLLSTRGFKNVNNMAGGVSTIKNPTSEACLQNNYVTHDRQK